MASFSSVVDMPTWWPQPLDEFDRLMDEVEATFNNSRAAAASMSVRR